MVVALLVAALIADIALSIIVHILFKEVEELREHEQNINLELVDLASKNRDISIIQNTLKDNDDTCHKLYVKMENEVDDLEKRLTASHKYFEIKYSGILGNVNDLWTHMDATEKVVLSLSEKTSPESLSTALKTAINSVYGLASAKDKEEINENDANADSKEEQNTAKDVATSDTDISEHKMKEPRYVKCPEDIIVIDLDKRNRHRHFYTYNSKPVSLIPDIPEDKEEINENDSNAGSKEEQNTENDTVTMEQTEDDNIPTFNDPSSIQK